MLQPRRTKFRKMHRGRRGGLAFSGGSLEFGQFGIKSLEPAWITARQIEAARRAITRHLRRGGQVWIRIFPDKPITHKPQETRQGGGKGNVEQWVAVVKRGRVLFEVGGVAADTAKEALRLAAHKLPVATRMVRREELYGAESS
ncbi:MAG: 50S ribosomal protein L16 [SAR202 cluster bacterium Io17-Chloro-G3]|nr:MAG: 50S ribosomal protein L16 [SAR202 cluster bacterium Io17-Chloro-G3]